MVVIKVKAISMKDETAIEDALVIVDNIKLISMYENDPTKSVIAFNSSMWVKVDETVDELYSKIMKEL